MNIARNEIRTGLLVIISLFALVGILLYLGAPGFFVPQNTFRIYFDNASGIKPGADVLLAGRKIGQVSLILSPVPEADRPDPKFEVLVETKVAASARVYKNAKVQMVQTSLLGEAVIDITSGREADGLATDGHYFRGERQPGLADAVPQVLDRIDPAIKKVTETLDTLQITSQNLNKLTAEGADLQAALKEFREFGANLKGLSGPEASLQKSLANIEKLTGPDGRIDNTFDKLDNLVGPESSLARTLKNAESFTDQLANNKDISVSLRNFRSASDQLNRTMLDLGPDLSSSGHNLNQATDTLKRQPWRLVWPTTKKYPEEKKPARATPRPVQKKKTR